MAETFSVGEIAIYARRENDGLPNGLSAKRYPIGQECTVIEGLGWRPAATDKGTVSLLCYVVLFTDGRTYGCVPEWLRKRRPPPDWKAIAAGDVLVKETAVSEELRA